MTATLNAWRDAVLVVVAHSLLLACVDPAPAADTPRIEKKEITMASQQPYVRDEASTAMAIRMITHIDVQREDVEDWSDDEILAAEKWASAVHIHKTLKDIKVPPMPDFLTRYQGEVRP